MNHRNTSKIVAALVGGGVLALSVPALAAVNVSSPPAGVALQIVGKGTIVARGAAVRMIFRVTCPTTSSTYLTAQASERVGRGVAAGSNARTIACSNVPQLVTLVLPAQAGGRPFVPGSAASSAGLESYLADSAQSVELRTQRVITLQR